MTRPNILINSKIDFLKTLVKYFEKKQQFEVCTEIQTLINDAPALTMEQFSNRYIKLIDKYKPTALNDN